MQDDIIDISYLTEEEQVHTVASLNLQAKFILEANFDSVLVEGEISNFVMPSSGHWYFSLKDSEAQIRCAMFQPQNQRQAWQAKNGMKVIARGKLSLYAARGDYQLIIRSMEETGAGALRRAFEQLKQKLMQEGLFAANRKRALPAFPKCIGIITSPTGAAIRDTLSVLNRRYPYASIIIYPSLVQGELAANQLVNAITIANQRAECDVLLLVRGGGSLEDLWPFNEEIVARAIATSRLPIVSGIGHEIDFTIADFVSDYRAPTPSVAAETVSPDSQELLVRLANILRALQAALQQFLYAKQQQLTLYRATLRHPLHYLAEQTQALDRLDIRLRQSYQHFFRAKHSELAALHYRLTQANPRLSLATLSSEWQNLQQRLWGAVLHYLRNQQHRLTTLSIKLHSISPLATLNRGYAIATLATTGELISASKQLQLGDLVAVRLLDFKLECQVIRIKEL